MSHVKKFILRGLIFGGLGPIVLGIVFIFIFKNNLVSFSGVKLFFAIISTYIIAFIQAGSSVFKEIEDWSLVKASGVQLLFIYITYTACYLINSWIPFKWSILLIYTLIFVFCYAIIWITVYLIVKKKQRQ